MNGEGAWLPVLVSKGNQEETQLFHGIQERFQEDTKEQESKTRETRRKSCNQGKPIARREQCKWKPGNQGKTGERPGGSQGKQVADYENPQASASALRCRAPGCQSSGDLPAVGWPSVCARRFFIQSRLSSYMLSKKGSPIKMYWFVFQGTLFRLAAWFKGKPKENRNFEWSPYVETMPATLGESPGRIGLQRALCLKSCSKDICRRDMRTPHLLAETLLLTSRRQPDVERLIDKEGTEPRVGDAWSLKALTRFFPTAFCSVCSSRMCDRGSFN